MSRVIEVSGVGQAAVGNHGRKPEKRRQARNRQLLFEPLEDRRMLSAWPMRQADIWNTGRADYVVPSERLNDSFFDVFLWQQRTPGSPLDGDLSSTSMTFYDGVGPGGADLVVGGYHWPKGVQGMDRHTGEVFWFGNPDGGEAIGWNTPAFSNDGSVIYVTNEATPHPLMAFESTEGPSDYWHNGDDSGVTNLMGSPVLAPDGLVFLYGWYDRAYGATDNGTSLTTTWSAATQTRPTYSEPALYEDAEGLRVIVPGYSIAAYDGVTGAQLWNVATPSPTEATATIDPANGNVYVSLGSGDIYLAGLDKEGQPLWGTAAVLVYDWIDGSNNPQRAQSAGALSHDGATYYFQTVNQEADGQLYAINTADGSVKWSYATGSGGWHERVSSPIVTSNGVIVVGNNEGDTYFAIRDVGTEGQLLDTYVVDEAGMAKASATLSADGRLYLPLRTVQIVGTPSETPSVQVENLFTAFDMTADAQATLPPPGGQKAIALNHQVVVGWRELPDPAGSFDHYAIYRGTAPFGTVQGMLPIATVSDIATTEYSDTTAENGTSCYYAVTTVTTTGGQQTNVSSIGPRTPRNETDLQVVSIARSPEFPRYDPQYTYYEVTEPSGFGPYVFSASTGLGGGQTFEDQRFPDIGDPVTYTATVRNRGTNNWGGAIFVSWFLDGVEVLPDEAVVNLAPGETTTFTYDLPWHNQSHELTFTINGPDARPQNNTLTSDPLAVPFLTYMDESFIEDFREVYTTDPSQNDDIIDWLNSHMARFNEMFLEAGSAKRVHYGVLEVLADDTPDPPLDYSDNPYAIFPFRYRKTDGNPRWSGYYYGPEDIDYGLIHEMAHQLGMIDLYQLGVPAWANEVSGLAYPGPDGLMRTVAPFLSEHSALAMEHWLHVAHGYYGQYLYNIPQTLKLRLLDYQGQPLSGAQVTMYQYAERPGQGKVISNQVKATGLTDEQGYFTLPNVDINEALVPPVATGDVLQDNPFGYVAVVGTNGVLHFRVEKDDATDYCWLDITEANVEYWNENVTEAVFDRQLMLGMPIQTQPSIDLAEPSAGRWIAWADGATATAEYDTERTVAGTASLKFVTDGGFDTAARYPGDYIADWDLSDAEYLALSVYAENDNIPTFQGGSPWIRLIDADGDFFQYQYTVNGWPVDVLIDAIGSWESWQVPLDAPEPVPGEVGSGWRRTAHGTPDLTSIQALEFHADTWGGGFRYWLDAVGFERLIANPDAYVAAQNGQQDVGPDSGLLANDVAPSGTSLTAEVVAEPMHGQLVLNPDGSFRYTPDAGFVGQDRFTYVARAGEAVSNVGEVLLDVLQTTFAVTNTGDEGPGSLRDALWAANASPLGPVTIEFQIPDTDPRFIDIDNDLPGGDPQPDVFVIRPLSRLPALENRSIGIVLDGRTQTDLTGNTNPAGPVVVLDGSTEGLLATGLEIRSDGNAVFGLNIVGFAYQGIYIAGSDNQIAGNYIGTDATGNRTTYPFGGETLPTGNGSNGIEVWYARRNEIRDNVISGNDREGVRIFGPEIPVFQWPVSEGGNGHYYVISPPSTWAAAEVLAQQLDISGDPNQRSSYLATITSAEEQEFLNRRFFTDMFGGEPFFMGLTDEAEEGTFVWVTGEPVSYTNWSDGEPNDSGGEDYGTVNFQSLGKWNDVGTDWIARGIIELESAPDMEELLPLLGTGGNRVSGNKIGTDASGQEALPNGLSGVFLERAQQTLIGGVLGDDWSLAEGNLISGNGWEGITVGWGCTDTQIFGNYIGTDIDGADAVSNRERGIAVYRSARSSIGATAGLEGNLISGNGRHGVLVEDWDSPVYEWSLDDGGNGHHYAVLPSMSWDAAEQVAQAMGGHLASITSADEQSFVRANILGDDAYLHEALWIGLNDVLQEGRFVWTSGESVSYTNWHPNEINGDGGDGENAVVINARRDTPAERGTWSDARRDGHLRALVEFSTPPDPAELAEVSGDGGQRIAGNRIGTTRDGLAALPNAEAGIHLANSSRNVIGGSGAEQGNLISGNAQTGIWIYGNSSRRNVIEGNSIGLTAAGDAALGNGRHGVLLDWAPENRLGPDNVISANTEHGVAVWGMSSEGNEITGNRIGTAVDGQVALGNGWHGIEAHAVATVIRGNLVSGNHQHGISLDSSEIPIFTRPEDGRVYVVAPSNTWAEAERWAQQLSGDLVTINDQAEQDFLRETILEGRFPNEWFWIGLNDRVREGDFVWSGEDSEFRNWHPGSPDTGNSGVEKNGVVINYRTSDEDPRGLWSDMRSGMWLRALIEFHAMPDMQRVHEVLNAGGAVVQGNWIGLQAEGSSDLGNLNGLWIGAPNNVIGGVNPGEGNVVAWNRGGGIELHGDSSAYNMVLGNYVGTDPSGALAWGNQGNGVTIANGAHHNTIGGTTAAAGNLISANVELGIHIGGSDTTGNAVQGNRIGTDDLGALVLGNGGGVEILGGAHGNTIGGLAEGAGNVIAGNQSLGVGIRLSAHDNTVSGNVISANAAMGVRIVDTGSDNNLMVRNRIGTDAGGLVAMGNGAEGIAIGYCVGNQLIGNVIGGNASHGISIDGAVSGMRIEGNLIGVGADGTTDVHNLRQGIEVLGVQAVENSILDNVIGYNRGTGIVMVGAAGNVVQGNFVGTDVGGTQDQGNGGGGIYLENASDNKIGGVLVGEGNTIAFNHGDGVMLLGSSAVRNPVRGNSVYENGALGIDLAGDGVTPNDFGDPDEGPNRLQNYPKLSLLQPDYLAGTLDSAPLTTFDIDVFASRSADPSGYGEGARYLGTFSVTTDEGGIADFDYTLDPPAAAGEYITLTATDPDGNTSEFSRAYLASGPLLVVTNTNDSGAGSLRQAMLDSLAALEEKIIVFEIPLTDEGCIDIDSHLPGGDLEVDVCVIAPLSPLPALSGDWPVTIDGWTQAEFAGETNPSGPEIVIDGYGVGVPYSPVLELTTDVHALFGLNIQRATGNGIEINGDFNSVVDCYIGTDPLGTSSRGNSGAGVVVRSSGNFIQGNVISGNQGHGVLIWGTGTTGNVLVDNRIGTHAAGNAVLPNAQHGVSIESGADGNTIGGAAADAGNLISGNAWHGVNIARAGAGGNQVLGNRIGTDLTGTQDLGNENNGVAIDFSPNNLIMDNIISGNNNGVTIWGDLASENVIQGNLIGVAADGSSPLGNSGHGVAIGLKAWATTIGGSATGSGNVIADNGANGIDIWNLGPHVAQWPVEQGGNGKFYAVVPPMSWHDAEMVAVSLGGHLADVNSQAEQDFLANTFRDQLLWIGLSDEAAEGTWTWTSGAPTDYTNWADGQPDGGTWQNVAVMNWGAPGRWDDDWSEFSHCGLIELPGPQDPDALWAALGYRETLIQGNHIGTNADGSAALGNAWSGIYVGQAERVIVGGTEDGSGNIISANGEHGIHIYGHRSERNEVTGNYIGTNEVAASADWGNGGDGLFVNLAPGAVVRGNVISGNSDDGIHIFGPTARGTIVQANRIGTDLGGTLDWGNRSNGVHIENAPGSLIGGTADGEGNLISGNDRNGLEVRGFSTRGTLLQGNHIGTQAGGIDPLANGGHGIWVNEARETRIGGTDAGAGNVISANTGGGVVITSRDLPALPSVRWTEGNGHAYVLIPDLSWSDALEAAGQMGGYLASVTSAPENDFLAANFTVQAWIGLTDEEEEGLWQWTSGETLEYTNWNAGEPSNTDGYEDYAFFNATPGGTWNDVPGWHLSSALVEFDGEPDQDLIADVLATRAQVQGNLLGLDAHGLAMGNGWNGVEIHHAGSNEIGGTEPEARNVISDNAMNGVSIYGRNATYNVVFGNYIGTNVTGDVGIGNQGGGVVIGNDASDNRIGGDEAGSRNVISGNFGDGVSLLGARTSRNTVQANYIGLNAAGGEAIGNQAVGVAITLGANQNTVSGNVISANTAMGVRIVDTGSDDNLVMQNRIGTDASGLTAMGNGTEGIAVGYCSGNQLVGNVIGGNASHGISVDGAVSGMRIEENYVGVGLDGTTDVHNRRDGIQLIGVEAVENSILDNVIGYNQGIGIAMQGATRNVVQGNFVGTDTGGTRDQGNGGGGIYLDDASNNAIGGVTDGEGNRIGFNHGSGVVVVGPSTSGNTIRGNSIDGNAGLGIDLGGNGVTPNDSGDVDTGPNNLQNYPVLSAAVAGSVTQITGQLDSTPDNSFAIDFYTSPVADSSGNGEGARYLGSTLVTTDPTGTAVFDVVLPIPGSGGDVVTATATDADGNTSEFSAALTMVSQDAAAAIQLVAVHAPSPSNEYGEVANLPASADWVHEWQSFWVEIWVSTPDTTEVGVAEATVDLRYDTSYLTAQQIVHGPAFTLAQTGVIDDAQGVVSAIGGRTSLHNVGDDGYVLLARVKFASTVNDQVPVDEARRNIGPYGIQMVLPGGQVVLVGGAEVTPDLGTSPGTELWAVVYDIDDNNQIDFGDLSFFAAAFGLTVGSTGEPPYAWWADFDKSGRVDFGDLSFFAPNFNKSRDAVQSGTQTLIFPPRFPDPWRAGTGGGEAESEGESDSERESERESEVAWEPSAGGVRVARGSSGPPHAAALPRQLAWAVDEAHAALQAEQSPGLPWGMTVRHETQSARPLWQESPGTLYSRSDEPEAPTDERPDRHFDDWEPLEDLLTTLAVR